MTSGVQWRRMLGEGTLIVVSILLGLSIDAWWDGQQAAEVEQDVLAALRDEVAANRDDLDRHRQGIEDQIGLMQLFLRSTPDEMGRVPEDSLPLIVRALARPLTYDARSGAAALLSDNPVLSREGIRIRTLVTEWRTLIADAEDEKGRVQQRATYVQERLASYAARAEGAAGEIWSQMIAALGPTGLAEIRADPLVVEAVILKSATETAYLLNLRNAGQVLDSLVAELDLP